jgi:hypothetical protein
MKPAEIVLKREKEKQGRTCSALISNFVEEKTSTIRKTKRFC